MYAILSLSGTDALEEINHKPVLDYILDELSTYISFIDGIVIASNEHNKIIDYLNFSKLDDFIITKIHVTESSGSMMGDLYAGMSHIVDNMNGEASEIIFWKGDTILFNSSRLTDMTMGSFAYYYEGEPIGIYRFNDFVSCVNTCVSLNEKNMLNDFKPFIQSYSEQPEIVIVDDSSYEKYLDWKSDPDAYYTAKEYLAKDNPHSNFIIEVDLEKRTLTKINKYVNEDYTNEIHLKTKNIQSLLYAEYDCLSNCSPEQQLYLPVVIECGMTRAGNFIDELTEEYVRGKSLDEYIASSHLNWHGVMTNILEIIDETFHITNISEDDDSVYYAVRKSVRDDFIKNLETEYKESIDDFLRCQSNDNLGVRFLFQKSIWDNILHMAFDESSDRMFSHNDIIYQGKLGRMVHGDLCFKNIMIDHNHKFHKFVSPCTGMYTVAWRYRDYISLYTSMMIDPVMNGYFNIRAGMNTVAMNNMYECNSAMTDFHGSDIIKRISCFAVLDTIKKINSGYYNEEIVDDILVILRSNLNKIFQYNQVY